ncbi:MAG: T9SS type A sorting domain-containing protein [Flavobacteriales bacterium]|nr:T9SS type A sorting domain-containing protein [Flavobacteriales bacterium]MCC6938445.1 T9SS type A sorting domain-containing protein [Flavobacteriales bacterium]
MTKIYASTLVLAFAIAGGATAQTRTAQAHARIPMKATLDQPLPVGPAESGARSTVLWEDDFSDANTWSIGHDGTIALDWQIGMGLVNTGDYPTQPVNSPTQANGYAMLDSDGANNSTGLIEQSHMTNVTPFSTAGYPNVVLEFETFYRKWTNEECYIQVSTNNTDWITLDPTSTDVNPIPNVYEAFPGMVVQAVIMNPTRVRINISDAAGDQPQVWIRFYWSGEWGYSWFVDDVKVIEQPAYELLMEDGYLSSTGNGEEYGRIPVQHLQPTMLVGGNFLNFGVNDATNANVSLAVSGPSPFGAVGTPMDLASAEGSLMEQTVSLPNSGALGTGMYNGVFTLTSDQDGLEEDLTNNVYLRNFEVNPDWYSVDGIGNHPAGYQSLGALGTNSFTDGADGLVMFNYYQMQTAQTVFGVDIGITSNSQAGSYFIVSIHDTLLTATTNLPIALFATDVVDVTDADITAGHITVPFDTPVDLAPNGYYVAVALYSNGGANLLRIPDDLTVPEPGLTSGIQIPADQVYSNGNAFQIRLATTNVVSVPENGELEGITVFPNPVTDGRVNIRSTRFGNFSIRVLDMTGREVMNTRSNGNTVLDLSGQASGVYMVRVSDGDASTVQRITLN